MSRKRSAFRPASRRTVRRASRKLGYETLEDRRLLAADITTGLAGYWQLEETAIGQTVIDSSGLGNNGSHINITTPDGPDTNAAFGVFSLSVDGVDDYVSIPADTSLDLSGGQFTQSIWVYPEFADTGFHGVLGHQPTSINERYPGIWIWDQSRIHAGFGDGTSWNGFSTGSVVTPSDWNHIVTTFDGTDYKVYVNAVEVDSDAGLAGLTPHPTQQLDIGRVDNNFEGSIDEVRIYQRALTQEDVTELFTGGVDTVAPAANLISVAQAASVDITVEYSDNFGIDVSTLDSADLRITGPASFNQLASFVGVDIPTNGTPRTADYSLTTPAVDGTYTVALELSQVSDTSGNFAATAVLGTFVIDSTAVEPDPTGLVGRWKLDETAIGQTVIDSSGQGNNGSHINITTPDGPDTNAAVGLFSLSVDGADDYASIPADASLDLSGGQFTQSIWVYPEFADTGFHGVLGYQPTSINERYPSIWIWDQNRIHAGFGDGTSWNGLSTGSVVTPFDWNHIVTTFDGTDYKVYVNAVEVDSDAGLAGLTPHPTQQLDIGRVDNNFEGSIDDVWIYTRALNATEVGLLFNLGAANPATLSLSINDASIDEGDGPAATFGTVTRDDVDLSAPLTVNLLSNDTSEATVLATIEIPIGNASANFDIDAVDDLVFDGTQTVSISATAAGHDGDSQSLDVTDDEVQTLSLTLNDASIDEGAGPAATFGTVTRNDEDLSTALTVNLLSDDTSEATVLATVDIPIGIASANFDIDAVDDLLIDGTQIVNISVSAAGYVGDSQPLDVTDDEGPTLTVTIVAASIDETDGTGATTATVNRIGADISSSLLVTLASDDTSEATVAASVLIPANQPSATFDIDAKDDLFADGTKTVTITVSAAGFVQGADTVDVTDNEVRTLTVTIAAASIGEIDGPVATTGTVSRNDEDLTDPLVISLSSSDTSEATVPATVTIPANQASANFDIDAVDDAFADGTQTVTITADAFGTVRFAMIGDFGDNSADSVNVASLVSSQSPDFIVTAGDNRYDAFTYQQVVGDHYGQYLPAVSGGTSAVNKFFPSTGNHDYNDGGGISEYLAYFDLPGSVVPSTNTSGTERYYDVIQGPVHFFFIDSQEAQSNPTDMAAQQNWLQTQMLASTSAWQIVVLHHAPFSSSTVHGSNTTMQLDYAGWGADAVLAGHDHTYERIAQNGIPYFVNGLGGRSIYAFDTPIAGSQVRYNSDYGAMIVDASEAQMTFQFVNTTSSIIDTFVVNSANPPTPYVSGMDVVDVTDNEVQTLTVTIATASISETAGPAATTATVSRNDEDISSPLLVTLASDDTSEAAVAPSVTIPANQPSATFDIDAVDDLITDGTQTVTITASAGVYVQGADTVDVTDNEVPTLTVTITAASIGEIDGPAATTATVSRSGGDISMPLEVTLLSDDLSEAAVNVAGGGFVIEYVGDFATWPGIASSDVAGLTFYSPNGTLILADSEINELPIFTGDNLFEVSLTGAPIQAYASGNNEPTGITYNEFDGFFYVVNDDTKLLSRYESDPNNPLFLTGPPLFEVLTTTAVPSALDPEGITSDPATGLMYVADGKDGGLQVLVYDHLLNFITSFPVDTELDDAEGIAYSTETDSLLILDGLQNKIAEYDVGGTLGTLLREYDISGFAPAPVAVQGLSFGPTSDLNDDPLALSLYIADGGIDNFEDGRVYEATFVPTVTIPANQTSATFDLDAVDDLFADGTQTVTVTAAAAGFIDGADSVDVTDNEVPTLTVTVATASVSEGDGAAATTATVSRNDENLSGSLVVNLASDDTSEASVPASVLILAGQTTSAPFNIDAVNDALVDGTKTVTVTASAGGYVAGVDMLDVTDDDVLTLTLSIAATSVSEDAGAAATTATVSRNDEDLSSSVLVNLLSDDTSEATVQASVTIPVGQINSAAFNIDAVDDALVDGTQTVTLTASATSYANGVDMLDVTDDESVDPTGLVGHWKLEETSIGQTVIDASGQGNDGAHVNITSPDGPDNNSAVGAFSLRVDGVDDYVGVPADTSLDLSGGQFTQSVWIYPEFTDNDFHGVLGYQPTSVSERYPGIWVWQQDRIHAGFGDGISWNGFSTGNVLTAFDWNHVVTTFDGTTYKVYVDAIEVHSSPNLAGKVPFPTQQLNIGRVDNNFDGKIDDVRIYNRVLDGFEVGLLTGLGPPNPGTIQLATNSYSVNEPNGTVTVDVVRVGGNQGTVTVNFTTVDGSATSPDDYTPTSGIATFLDGQIVTTVNIPIIDDTAGEGNESFGISLDATGGGAGLGFPRTATITIVDDDAPSGTGNGLRGEYYDNIDLTNLTLIRTDAVVDFDWIAGSPDPSIQSDTFSVRWTGQVEPVITETYAFSATTDDGVRLWVDGQLIIDRWVDQQSATATGNIQLIGGNRYDIVMEFYENTGAASTKLEWSSATTALEVIPQSQLYDGSQTGPTMTIGASVINVDEAAGTALVTVLRFGDTSGTSSVQYATSDGSATAGSDYTAVSGTLNFAIDETSQTILIPISDDLDLEENETINLTLSSPTGGILGTQSSTIVKILDDDPGDFTQESFVAGLNAPTTFEFAADGRLFVAQKEGTVLVYSSAGTLEGTFIDISAEVNNRADRGLLGFALHPNFLNPATAYAYLLYTYDPPETQGLTGLAGPDGAGNRVARMIRVTADLNGPFPTAIPGTEMVILGAASTWANISEPGMDSTGDPSIPPSCAPDGTLQDCLPADSRSHTIGTVKFSPDGSSLFVSNGDGTSFGIVDPRTVRVQDKNSLSGKILRIDPITGAGFTDNPFYDLVDVNSNQSKVYSYGLRNPFRFAIQPVTGEPYIGDVGWTKWEEINTGEGANFGWPYYEGGSGVSLQTEGYRNLPEAIAFYASGELVEASIYARPHSDGATAIIMGDFYTGSTFPTVYHDALFFADVNEGSIKFMTFDGGGNPEPVRNFANGIPGIVQMITGPDGNLYYTVIGGGPGTGEIRRFVPGGAGEGGGGAGGGGAGGGSGGSGGSGGASTFFVVDTQDDTTYHYPSLSDAPTASSLASGNRQPEGVAATADGSTVWVADRNQRVYVYDGDGNALGKWRALGLSQPRGIATDGTDVWIVDDASDRIYYFAGGAARTSGSVVATSSFALDAANTKPAGLTSDGQFLWVVDRGTDEVFKYTTSGLQVGQWKLDPANTGAQGITINPFGFSPALWVVDSTSKQVFEYADGANYVAGSQTATAVFDLDPANADPRGIADPPSRVSTEQTTTEPQRVASPRVAPSHLDALAFTGIDFFRPAPADLRSGFRAKDEPLVRDTMQQFPPVQRIADVPEHGIPSRMTLIDRAWRDLADEDGENGDGLELTDIDASNDAILIDKIIEQRLWM